MTKAVAIIQARMDSSRLPGKVLKDLSGKAVLQWCVDAARATSGIDRVVVATSDEANDNAIADYCKENKIDCYRGNKDNVLERMVRAGQLFDADIVMRLTADCPLLDPDICGAVLYLLQQEKCDYASNVEPVSWPDGVDCEVMTLKALETALDKATSKFDKEHVTAYIQAHQNEFKTRNLSCLLPGLHEERWTLDDQGDFDFLEALTAKLKNNAPSSYMQVLDVLKNNPDIYKTRKAAVRNEGAQISQANAPEETNYTDFSKSKKALERAEKVIPLGSQTFSKSKIQFPPGASPLMLSHGRGGRVWDVDGNEYVDYICGLLPVSLGYCDPDIDYAIRTQLNKGISFSLATELEAELAERMIDIVPCAEMVRFGKNGTDATSAAIRLARAHTGRDRVMALGYHGWQDWYIGATTRNLGVPKAVSELTHKLPHNNIDVVKEAIAKHKGEFAAIILEAASGEEPKEGYLEELREITKAEGIVLVFDEIIMGFRQHLGGSQAYYGVTPDLAAFGKGMANGMPISAITGSAEIMRRMEDIFYSGTFGGEALSIAASIATIDKMKAVNAIDKMHATGQKLADEVTSLIKNYQLDNIFKLIGIAPWKIMTINGTESVESSVIQTRYVTQMFRHGILTGGTHNICYAHDDADIAKTIYAYDQTLALIKDEIDKGTIEQNLPVPPIKPIFKVRG